MGMFVLGFTTLLIAFGISHGLPQGYLFNSFEEVDSDEYGQFAGKKSTNCSCGWTNKEKGRIVGGRETDVNEFPHMAGLVRLLNRGKIDLYCGSSIITTYHALTAAHCIVEETGPLAILTGEHDLKIKYESQYTKLYNVEKALVHGDYSRKTYANDIALLVIEERITFNQAVGPICLPTKPMGSFLEGKAVKVTGWGDLSFNGLPSDKLLKVNLKVVPLYECVLKYRGFGMSLSKPTQFCTYRDLKDSCQGDSGGPVTWLDPETNRYTLVGLVSFGKSCASTSPGVNTDVYEYMDWIQKNIAGTSFSSTIRTCAKRN